MEKSQFYWDHAALAVLSQTSRQIEAEYRARRRVGGLGKAAILHGRKGNTARNCFSRRHRLDMSIGDREACYYCEWQRTFLDNKTCPSGEANKMINGQTIVTSSMEISTAEEPSHSGSR